MKTIEFIKKNSLQKLIDDFGIVVTQYPDRLVLNYHTIDSPKTAEITKECRALILRRDGWKVLCRSFDRFFNYGEAGVGFDFIGSEAFEKLDGSLVNFYHDGSVWNFATRKMAFAEGPTSYGKTFDELIRSSLTDKQFSNMKALPKDQTYIFEFTSPYTRLVTRYTESKLTLLSIRNSDTGEEMPQDEVDLVAQLIGVNRPKKFKFPNYGAALKYMEALPKLEEGYVCIDKNGNRVKIKSPTYLAIAHLRNNGQLSEKRVTQLVMSGADDEYLEDFPEDHPTFSPYRRSYVRMLKHIVDLQRATIGISNKKEFALIVKDTPVASIMFQLKAGRPLDEIINNMKDNARVRLLKAY